MTVRSNPRQIQPLPIDQIPQDHVFLQNLPDWAKHPSTPAVVRRLYAVYGPVVVTPTDVTDPPEDFQATLTPEYQAKLAEADKLAVLVGGNQPLRCVVFERKEDMEVWSQAKLITVLQDASRWYGLSRNRRATDRAPIEKDKKEPTI